MPMFQSFTKFNVSKFQKNQCFKVSRIKQIKNQTILKYFKDFTNSIFLNLQQFKISEIPSTIHVETQFIIIPKQCL